ncbi:hypothetical protein [Peribacillus sp. SCS-37]|uniref:hypothetical protein n=1 Tax=Paraperibacillus esterisolvens TaxID=3115296 RepID=UPI00390594A0
MSPIQNAALEHRLNLMIYHLQTNEHIHLSDKSLWDLKSNYLEAFKKLEKEILQYREDNHALRWNELRLYLKRNKPQGCEEILSLMESLDKKESIR